MADAVQVVMVIGGVVRGRGWLRRSEPFLGTSDMVVDDDLIGMGVQGWVQLGLLAAAVVLLMGSGWGRLVARLGTVVAGDAGWALAAFAAVSGVASLQLLFGA